MRRRIDSINITPPAPEEPTPSSSHAHSQSQPSDDQPVAAKSRKIDVDLLSDFKFKPCSTPTIATPLDDRHEIEKYLSMPVTEIDSLQFWEGGSYTRQSTQNCATS